jgi:hypothetical protein
VLPVVCLSWERRYLDEFLKPISMTVKTYSALFVGHDFVSVTIHTLYLAVKKNGNKNN